MKIKDHQLGAIMKSLFRIVILVAVLINLGFGQDKKYVIGFDASVLVGKIKLVDGGIKSVLGVSPLLGVGYKSYFKPLKQDKYSVYWDIGTDLLVLPFLGLGLDYRFKAGDLPLYAGINVSSRLIAILIPIPSLNIGLYF